jgi:hypothetical protein
MPEQWPCLVQQSLCPSFVMSANPSSFLSNAVVSSPGLSVCVPWLRRLLLSFPDRPMLWAVVEALSVFLPVRPELWPLSSNMRTHRCVLSEAPTGSGVCKINARQLREHFSKGRRPPSPPDFNVGLTRRAPGGSVPKANGDVRGRKQIRASILQDKNTPCRQNTPLKSGGRGVATSEEANLGSADRKTGSGLATKCRAFILQTPDENFCQVLEFVPASGVRWAFTSCVRMSCPCIRKP